MSITPISGYGTALFIVSTVAGQGTHTTLAAAMAAASAGDTIFLRTSVTENVTITPGVNIVSWAAGSSNTPSITGTLTMTAAGTSTISGIRLVTNSAPALTLSGSADSQMFLSNCYLSIASNPGMSLTSSGTSSFISCTGCILDTNTTGVAVYSMTNGNNIRFLNCFLPNSGSSTVASNNSAGAVLFDNCSTFGVYSSTSTGSLGFFNCNVDASGVNTTPMTFGGTGSHVVNNCYVTGGSAVAISIGAGNDAGIFGSTINSSNTNPISGSGSLNSSGNSYPGTSQINAGVTQTGGTLKGQTVAPPAGYLGQQITSSVSAVATSTSTPVSIANISLTAGIWDISAITGAVPTGGTAAMTTHACGIGTTLNTLTGTLGVDYFQSNVIDSTKSGCVPQIRATLTATTTYYLTVFNTYTSTTCPTNGRITATRVG